MDSPGLESECGAIVSVKGPRSSMYELVQVGTAGRLGEVVSVGHGGEVTVHMFENTSGLAVGDAVRRTGRQWTVELGPGLLGGVFDGLQRPLATLIGRSSQNTAHADALRLETPALCRATQWYFEPRPGLKEGDCIGGGDVFGEVMENPRFQHRIMVPPSSKGEILYLAEAGNYTVADVVLELETPEGQRQEFTMVQTWPLRQRRPSGEKRNSERPWITGQRMLDVLFPCPIGGYVGIAGGFGVGKTTLARHINKHSNADIAVHVGCGQRGNELADMWADLRRPTGVRTADVNDEGLLSQRSVIVANTSNQPIAMRETAIFVGGAIAEYFRDQGYHVSLVVDSTSWWFDALEQLDFRPWARNGGPLPYAEARYRYGLRDRAGQVECLGQPAREGSVTIAATVSPPGSDLGHHYVWLCTRKCFWCLDRRLAQRKHHPAINWITSYSRDWRAFDPYHRQHTSPDFCDIRDQLREIMTQDNNLVEIVQLVGKECLHESDKATLDVAQLIKEHFFQQDAFSPHDAVCSLSKTTALLRNLVLFHSLARASSSDESPWLAVRRSVEDLIYRLGEMKDVEDSATGLAQLAELHADIKQAFL